MIRKLSILSLLIFVLTGLFSCHLTNQIIKKRIYRNGYDVSLPSIREVLCSNKMQQKYTHDYSPEKKQADKLLLASTDEQNHCQESYLTKFQEIDSIRTEQKGADFFNSKTHKKTNIFLKNTNYLNSLNQGLPKKEISKKNTTFKHRFTEDLYATESIETIVSTFKINRKTDSNLEGENESGALSIMSFLFGILAFICITIPSFIIVTPFALLAAIVLGIMGIIHGKLKGLAIAGLAIGAAILLLFFLIILAFSASRH